MVLYRFLFAPVLLAIAALGAAPADPPAPPPCSPPPPAAAAVAVPAAGSPSFLPAHPPVRPSR